MRQPSFVITLLLSGIAIMMGVVSVTHLLRGRFATAPIQPSSEQAGEVGSFPDPLIYNGPLQQDLAGVTPQVYLDVSTGESVPRFEKNDYTVKAGQVVSLNFHNRSTVGHRHNWVLVAPGTAKTVDREARQAGADRLWIPNSKDILAYVMMTDPGVSRIMVFRAPRVAGDYPFFCSFPGHAAVMNGLLHVVE
jgi:azurin